MAIKTLKHISRKPWKRTNRKQSRKLLGNTLHLIPLYNLSPIQIKLFSKITNDVKIMKNIGVGKTWSINDIKTFMKDEKMEARKPIFERRYYSFVLLKNNIPIGFISGRKNKSLLHGNNSTKNDLLLRLFICDIEVGRGYGTKIIELFIKTYSGIIKKYSRIGGNSKVVLYSDIHPDNIASIKIHEKNGFIFTEMKKYPNGVEYKRFHKKI